MVYMSNITYVRPNQLSPLGVINKLSSWTPWNVFNRNGL